MWWKKFVGASTSPPPVLVTVRSVSRTTVYVAMTDGLKPSGESTAGGSRNDPSTAALTVAVWPATASASAVNEQVTSNVVSGGSRSSSIVVLQVPDWVTLAPGVYVMMPSISIS